MISACTSGTSAMNRECSRPCEAVSVALASDGYLSLPSVVSRAEFPGW